MPKKPKTMKPKTKASPIRVRSWGEIHQKFKPFHVCTVWRMWLESRRSPTIQRLIDIVVSWLARRGLLTAEDYNAVTFGTRDDLKEFARQIIYIAEHGQRGLTLWVREFGFVVTGNDDESLHQDKQEMSDGRRSSAWRNWRYTSGDKRPALRRGED